MCAPAIIPMAMMAGTAMQAYGQYQQGQAAEAAARENVAAGEQEARDVYARAENDKQLLALQMRGELGTGRAQAGGSGTRIGTGSNLDWENDLLETYVSDRAQIDENAAKTVYGIQRGMRLEALQGKSGKQAGRLGSAASLLSGTGKAASIWYDQKRRV